MDNELFINTQLKDMAVHLEQASMLNWGAFMDPNLARNSDCFMSTEQESIFHSTPITDFSGDLGFAERAARFSCFGSRSFNGRTNNSSRLPVHSGKLTRVSSTPALKALVSLESAAPGRKRKSAKIPVSPSPSFSKTAEKKEEWDGKREEKKGKRKREEEEEEKNKSTSTKPPESPKDYIHVRARRGQATDSHSLAERVRREKIGERMKLLQDLVPGCNKVTGKALMLDEIINYVQSLQRQVEFLSMKLSSVNDTSLDFNVEPLMSKDIVIPSSIKGLQLHVETLHSESSNHHYHHHQFNTINDNSQFHANISSSNTMCQSPINSMETSTLAEDLIHLPTLPQFTDSISQYQMLSEEDLHCLIGMGVAHNSNHESQNKKIEL